MGTPKLLLPWQGKTIIEQVLASWLASPVAGVAAIIHPEDAQLADICRSLGAAVVQPQIPPPDMKTSVLHGLQHWEEKVQPTSRDAWLLAPADMPRISSAAITAVMMAHQPDAPQIIIPTFHGRRGHPVLFPWHYAKLAQQLGDDEGLNVLTRRFAPQLLAYASAEILQDVDTPEDYEKLK